jgi:hypothetical protein
MPGLKPVVSDKPLFTRSQSVLDSVVGVISV